MEGVIHVCWLKGIRKAAAWGKVHRLVSCLHSGHYHQRQRTNGDATCTCRYMQATICGSEPQSLHKAVLIGVQILVLQRTCPQVAAFLILYSQYRSWIAFIFQPDLSMYIWQSVGTICTHSKRCHMHTFHPPLIVPQLHRTVHYHDNMYSKRKHNHRVMSSCYKMETLTNRQWLPTLCSYNCWVCQYD